MERKRRRREKNLLARAMSRAICARSSSGPLNFFSSRRRSQNLTSIRFGGEKSCASKRSEEHTSELQSRFDLVCRLLLEKKKANLSLKISANAKYSKPQNNLHHIELNKIISC